MDSFAADGPQRLIAGRYRLIEPIGHGGMATVYRGQDEVLGRDIAVKLFRASAVAPDDVGRQETEMRLLASLSHPGLVTLFDAGKDDAGRDDGEAGEPRAFLVMELVDGPDLRKRLRDAEPLSPPDVAYVGAELAGALAYIHGRGVIHRDVKPANILLPPAIPGTLPRAKLTDFGIARMLDGARITAANSTLGTANYLSPEQASSHEIGFSSDIYSLGLVLLEAVTGRIEFGGSAVEAAIARLSRNPEVPEELGSYWCSLLRSMTSRDPDQRPTAAEVSAALLEYRWAAQTRQTAPPAREDEWEDSGEPTADVVLRTADDGDRMPVSERMPVSGGVPEDSPGLETMPALEREPAAARPAVPQASSIGATGAPPPPVMPPRVGRRTSAAASAVPVLRSAPGRPTRLALAGRTLLGFVAVAVLAMAVIVVADRLGIFPQDQGYPAVPGQLGENLRQLQESVTP